jgi:glycosyltransferase involved in cell wall biosynthesis
VEWLHLWVPPVPHLGQWLSARQTIRHAIARRSFDVLHVHQAQVADMADVWQVHYLSRPAWEHQGFADTDTVRGRIVHAEQIGVMLAEDYYLRRLHRAGTRTLFVSRMLRDQFVQHYELPLVSDVLLPPAPNHEGHRVSPVDRAKARRTFLGHPDPSTVVLGYLGGTDARKGYHELIDAVAQTPGVILLFGGAGSEHVRDSRIGSRLRSVGYQHDLDEFFAAIDALVVPSRFEPYGMVVPEAWRFGVPVIASPYVGGTQDSIGAEASIVWNAFVDSLEHAVQRLTAGADQLRTAALNAYRILQSQCSGATLIKHWSGSQSGRARRA